jgi:hypothetical protein
VGAIFLYLIYHDFRKINGRIKIFDKCTSGVAAHGGWLLPPYPHDVKTLPPWDTAAGAYFLRQAVHRGARTLPPRGTAAGACRRGARRQGFFSF